jgi:predicted ribosomally synthesized peptide with SipW-like signal peptide
MDRTKKILISMLVLGALAAVGGGTYASFNAVTTNPGNTFQTGTILLANDKNHTNANGTSCFSYGALVGGEFTSNSNACSTLVTVATTKPSATVTTVVLDLKNVGSLNGTLGMTTTCASADSLPAAGNRSLCDRLAIRIQECATYTNGNTSCTTTSVAHCVYSSNGANTAAACAALGIPGAPGTAGSLTAMAALPATTTVATLNAATEVQYEIDIQLPDTGAGADNDVQGKTATFAFTWTLS